MLPTFVELPALPESTDDIRKVLLSPLIRSVRCFALGPEGTNIAQACRVWIGKMALENKSEIELCQSVEESIGAARSLTDLTVLGLFWTCAVYHKEKDVFFANPDLAPFFTQLTMPLNEMQLCSTDRIARSVREEGLSCIRTVVSHPSPQPLLAPLGRLLLIDARSNGEAAALCASGAADACITTERARQLNGLERVHAFGSPRMVFFGGITTAGAMLVSKAREGAIDH